MDAAAEPGWWAAFTAWLAWLWHEPFWGALVEVALIVLVAWLARVVLKIVIKHSVDRIVSGVKAKYDVTETRQLTAQSPVTAVRRVRRAQSLGRVFSNGISAAIIVVAVLLVVWRLFPGATSAFALITAAVGAGLGIGAQGIVRDLLGGIFLAVEDQLGVGDVVAIGVTSGVVEDVGIRITQVRDVEGTLWFIRNGDIDRVGNMSHGWARAIVDYAVPYAADVDAAKKTVAEAAAALARDPKWRPLMLEKPDVWGIERVAVDHIIIRVAVRTRTSAKDDVARELRGRTRSALFAAGTATTPLASVTPVTSPEPSEGTEAKGEKGAATKPIKARTDQSGLSDERRQSEQS